MRKHTQIVKVGSGPLATAHVDLLPLQDALVVSTRPLILSLSLSMVSLSVVHEEIC